MKIKVYVPGFGERYCSSNVEYKLFNNGDFCVFYKKGTEICHNEYGPACEWKNGSYIYYINYKYHRLSDYAFFTNNLKTYCVINKYSGDVKEEFIKCFNSKNILN